MRKYIVVAILLSIVYNQNSFSQIANQHLRREVDSLKRILPSLKGIARVNALNMISDRYHSYGFASLQAEVDAESLLNQEAYTLARKLGYKQGIAYALMNMGSTEDERDNMGGNEEAYRKAIKDFNEAISIAKELDDNYIIGESYGELAWLEEKRDNYGVYSEFMMKSIATLEKAEGEKFKKYNDYATCKGCKGNESWLGSAYHNFGRALIGNRGKEDSIRLLFSKAIMYYKKAGDKAGEYNAYLWFRKFHYWVGDFAAQVEYTKKMVQIDQELGLDEHLLKDYTVLCNIYWSSGNFEQGIEYAKKSVELTERLEKEMPADSVHGWFASRGQGFLWMSKFYTIAGDFETALKTVRTLKQYLPSDSASTFLFLGVIGDIYRLMGKYDSAMYFLASFDNKPMLYPYFDGKIALRNLYLDMKLYDQVLKSIQLQAETRQKPAGVTFTQAGAAYIGKKDYAAALENARKGLTLFNGNPPPIAELMNCYQVLSSIYHTVGRDDSAYYYQTKYYKLKDSIVNRQFLWRLSNLKKQAEEERKTGQIKLLQKDNLIKEQQLRQQLLLKEQSEAQLGLLDKENKIKEQQLQLKDQELKQQLLIKDRSQSQLTLLDKENKLKDQRLKQQATIRNALLAGLLLFLALGIFVFRSLSLKRKNERLQNEKQKTELQQKASELEMQALRAQMNPHFIFNCLSSINKFILKNDTDMASDYLTRFSRLIRLGLTNSQLSLIPLSDEIEMLRLYLDMERLRFSETFSYNIIYENTIEPETIYIPPMLLQPFCENAIWHGLMHKEGPGRLDVMMSIQNGELQCIIADNGIGREKAAELKSKTGAKQKSFGLKITTERLALFNNEKAVHSFYKTEDVLDSNRKVAGTKVVLNIKFKNTIPQLVKEVYE